MQDNILDSHIESGSDLISTIEIQTIRRMFWSRLLVVILPSFAIGLSLVWLRYRSAADFSVLFLVFLIATFLLVIGSAISFIILRKRMLGTRIVFAQDYLECIGKDNVDIKIGLSEIKSITKNFDGIIVRDSQNRIVIPKYVNEYQKFKKILIR